MVTVPGTTRQNDALLRYNNGAVLLHWLTALLIVIQIGLGLGFANLPRGPLHSELFLWHKSLGATILVLAVIRLVWRLLHRPPPFPPQLSRWERLAAVWNHRLFYLLIIVIPLTGLTAVSDGARDGFTPLVGGLAIPVIPGVSKDAGEAAGEIHVLLVIATVLLLVIHVGAALKHQFIDRSRVSGRMPPFRDPVNEPVLPAN